MTSSTIEGNDKSTKWWPYAFLRKSLNKSVHCTCDEESQPNEAYGSATVITALEAQYQSEYRGIVQYYLLAHNVGWFNKLHWIAEASLLKTLAGKHRSSVTK